MDNSYLFDVNSRVVVASNGGKNDATLDLVTEYLGWFLRFRDLYGSLKRKRPHDSTGPAAAEDDAEEQTEPHANGDSQNLEAADGEEAAESGWWDDEDPDQPWAFQATRLLPNTTIAYWQFTPSALLTFRAIVGTDSCADSLHSWYYYGQKFGMRSGA